MGFIRSLRSAYKIGNGCGVRGPYGAWDEIVKKEGERVDKHSDDIEKEKRMQKLGRRGCPLPHALYGNGGKSALPAQPLKPFGGEAQIVMRFRHFICYKRRGNVARALRFQNTVYLPHERRRFLCGIERTEKKHPMK